MNVLRDYKLELFEILNLQPAQYSKSQLSKLLEEFIQTNGWDVVEFSSDNPPSEDLKRKYNFLGIVYIENDLAPQRYVRLDNPVMRMLTGITDKEKYSTVDDDGWWNLVTLIYKRYRL